MRLLDPIKEVQNAISKYGLLHGIRRGIGIPYARATKDFEGQNILDLNWDALIILDACRNDLFAEIAPAVLPIHGKLNTISSVASCTPNWIQRTFSERPDNELQKIGYISANPYSGLLPESIAFREDVWDYAWDRGVGTVQPRAVTDAAIKINRNRNFEKLIVHYLQPHAPFITNPTLSQDAQHFDIDEREGGGTWDQVQAGVIPSSKCIKAYKSDLQLVSQEVKLLLENIDAERTIVTADHGECFGEYGIYGHPRHVPIKPLVKVPWVTFHAKDIQSHKPADHESDDTVDTTKKLEALGYY